jgi:microcin C transport system substrate-binding protein
MYWSFRVNRRTLVTSALCALGAGRLPFPAWIGLARAEETVWRHGISLFDDVKYSPGFKHFDYVNAAAPKGGAVREIAVGTYDNFNYVVAGVKGGLAAGIDLIYETLLVSALDEVSTEYGLLAEAVSHPDDFSSATYRLRAQAKWHDGRPVTPEDAIFSFNAFKKNSPQFAAYYRHVTKLEKTGDREITFIFDSPGNRELPQIVGQLLVLPQHWWEGTDKNGNKRDIGATTLEPPLGSGAYRIKEFSAATISTNWASNISATLPSHLRPSGETRSTGAQRTAPRIGPLPTIFPPSRKAASFSRSFRSTIKA